MFGWTSHLSTIGPRSAQAIRRRSRSVCSSASSRRPATPEMLCSTRSADAPQPSSPPTILQRSWVGIDISVKAADLGVERIEDRQGLFRDIVHRSDLPQRSDLGRIPAYNSTANRKHLYGEQGGDCAACSTHFAAQHLEVDHIIAVAKGGTHHLSNLQLLCGHCNRVKGDRGMEYLRSKLQMAA